MKKYILQLLASSILAILSGFACAGTGTAIMTNTVTIGNACSITASGFTTTYDPVILNSTLSQDVTASVSTVCTIGALPIVTLGQGANAGTGSTDAVPVRRLLSTGPAVYLNYGLYSDATRLVIWGNTPATSPSGIMSLGVIAPVIVYARIPSGQITAKASTYTDTVTATVSF